MNQIINLEKWKTFLLSNSNFERHELSVNAGNEGLMKSKSQIFSIPSSCASRSEISLVDSVIQVGEISYLRKKVTGNFFDVWNGWYPPKSWNDRKSYIHLKLPLCSVILLSHLFGLIQWECWMRTDSWNLKLSVCYVQKSGNFKWIIWTLWFHDFGG